MPGPRPCPCCGTPIPGTSADGCCPGCLLNLAIDARSAGLGATEASAVTVGADDSRGSAPDAPGVATVAARRDARAGVATDWDAVGAGPVGGPPASIRYFGDYELIEPLGEGGMGVVYKARQVTLDRLVAVKMLHNPAFATEDRRRRFRIEAEAVARLDHPNIVPILEVGTFDGQPYYSMKLIRGQDLEAASPSYRGRHREIAGLIAAVADAVEHAHRRMVLHRDLKPANILIDDRGDPHVTDFGLARRMDLASGLTPTIGTVLGTPGYMALEQLEGRRDAVTARTDVYGLGAVLYALLAGRPPFREPHLGKLLDAVRRGHPEPPSHLDPAVPRALEAICLKCLETDPDRRYPSAEALADDLRRYLAGRSVAARSTGPLLRARDWRDRHRGDGTSALLGAAIGVVAGIVSCLARMRRFGWPVAAALGLGLLLLAATVLRTRPHDRGPVAVAPGDAGPGPVVSAPAVRAPEQVSVAIRQRDRHAMIAPGRPILIGGRSVKIPDQFEEHPEVGYLHPNGALDYRLELTNLTDETLAVVVTQRLGEGPPRETACLLEPGRRVAEAAVGEVSSLGLGPGGGPVTLTVEVHEDGGLGRALCEPKRVVFREFDPLEYISVAPFFRGGRTAEVGLFVHYLHTAPTAMPVHVTTLAEPFSAFRQVAAPTWIARGSSATHRFQVVDPRAETLKFSLNVDGIPDAIVREVKFQSGPLQPPAPGAGPGGRAP